MVSIKTFARLTPDNSAIEFYENNKLLKVVLIKDIKQCVIKHVEYFKVVYNNNTITITYSDFPSKIINKTQPFVQFDYITYEQWKQQICTIFLIIVCGYVFGVILVSISEFATYSPIGLLLGLGVGGIAIVGFAFEEYQKVKIK